MVHPEDRDYCAGIYGPAFEARDIVHPGAGNSHAGTWRRQERRESYNRGSDLCADPGQALDRYRYVGYVWSNDQNYTVDYLGLGTFWNFAPNWETWFLMFGTKTDNESSPDITELRPIVALKNLNFKVARQHGVLEHVVGGGFDD